MARIRQPARRRRPVGGGSSRRALLVTAAGAVALLAGVGTFAALGADPPADKDDCPVGRASPTTLVLLLDTTDALIATQPRRTQEAINAALADTPPGSRIAIQEIGGPDSSSEEAHPIYERCLPGSDSNAERNRRQDAVWKPIQENLNTLKGRAASPSSPILESLVQLGGDPRLHAKGTKLTIMLITDALQHSDYASAYSRRPWPDPKPGFLQGVTVRLVLLRNERDVAVQPSAVSRLTGWLRMASATLSYDEPSWLSLLAQGRR